MRYLRLGVRTRRYKWGLGAIFALSLICMGIIATVSSPQATALTTVPTKMNFQGRLTNTAGNVMPDGVYNMKFRLFTVSTSGASVWSEDRLVSAGNGVTITNGLFSVKLGDVTPIPATLFASGNLFFEIELPTPATATTSGAPTWTEGPMSPRNQLSTSAYAFNSETLDGLDSAAFLQAAGNNTLTGTNLFQTTNAAAVKIQNAGGLDLFAADTSAMKVGIGLANPTLGRLHVTWVTGDAAPAIYGGSSSGSNDQVGVLGRSGSGAGLQGISGSGFGMQASSTSNIAVLGTSVSSIGVQGRSDTSTSGLFVSTNTAGGNASATLVTRASVNQPGDLFQAQDSSNVSLFQINVNGSVQSKVSADSATGFVVQDAGGIAMLAADSVNDRIYIGNTAADGVGVTLVLDTKNTTGDPTGVNGAMYYNSDASKFRCYEASAWKDCISSGGGGSGIRDVSTSFFFDNDFMISAPGLMLSNATGTNAANSTQVPVINHPGIVRILTGDTATGRAGYVSHSASDSRSLILGNNDVWSTTTGLKLVNLSDGTNTFSVRSGFIDTGAGETVDGCFFRYTHSVNSGKWQGVCRDTNVESICDTGITANTTDWKELTVGVNGAGTLAAFVVNNVQVCTISTNIPTGTTEYTGFGVMILKSVGLTSRAADVDYIEANATGMTRL